jgi:hypothetical protein
MENGTLPLEPGRAAARVVTRRLVTREAYFPQAISGLRRSHRGAAD